MDNLEEIVNAKYRDVMVSLPTDSSWLDYIQDFITLKSNLSYFKIELTIMPKTRVEKRCFLVYENEIKGWMFIYNIEEVEGKIRLNLIPYLHSLPAPQKTERFTGFKYFFELSDSDSQ